MPNGSEKLRIAQDLHDGAVQDLAALGYAIDSIIGNPLLDPTLRAELREIRLENSRITAAVRNEILALYHDDDDINLLIADKFQKSAIELDLPEPLPKFPSEIDREVKKIVLEIVSNSIAHSGASKFSLRYTTDNINIEIKLQDNGSGKLINKPGHFGLNILENRAIRIGASIKQIETTIGTTYLLLIPRN